MILTYQQSLLLLSYKDESGELGAFLCQVELDSI